MPFQRCGIRLVGQSIRIVHFRLQLDLEAEIWHETDVQQGQLEPEGHPNGECHGFE